MAYNPNFFSISNNVYNPDRYTQAEPKHAVRGEFSKDRDRIMYSKAFRRLSGKTQIFLSTTEEDIRSRLTHTLEVNQIAKTIAISLGQNLELVEAIAFGHDIGHTPFGHVGERTLNRIMNNIEPRFPIIGNAEKGFKHNLQGLRLLCDIGNMDGHQGLNLSKYTLWGIANHSSLSYRNDPNVSCTYYDRYLNQIDSYWSFEGWIVALADEIAQRHHDIEDSIRYNIIEKNKLIEQMEPFRAYFTPMDKTNYNNLKRATANTDIEEFLRLFSRLIVNLYVVDVINKTKENMRQFHARHNFTNTEDFRILRPQLVLDDVKDIVSFSQPIKNADRVFHTFLKSQVLGSYMAQSMDGKGQYIIRRLFEAYISNPCQLPDSAIRQFYIEIRTPNELRSNLQSHINGNEKILMRVICDYIASMTDSYAYRQFDILYGTRIR
ncbi:MAG: dNTP triphosphohydrolase [Prevotella sp.]|nr:dNTP triphosphohydrolase [Prevotella sp.]